MRKFSLLCVLPFCALALCAPPLAGAGEQTQPEKGAKASLEERLTELEKRVRDMEQALAERAAPHLIPPAAFPNNMDELWNHFRRELESKFNMEFPNGPRGLMPGLNQRPRLGVELAPPSDDLAEQYKNNVKTGAFVLKVLPGSPAGKAGLKEGDAITFLGGQAVSSPEDAIAAVRGAPKGKIEIVVSRHGETLTLSADLGAAEDATPPLERIPPRDGWLKRGQGLDETAPTTRSCIEVKAGALELTEQLAKDLELTGEQQKKMNSVLAKEAKALTEEAASSTETGSRPGRGAYTLNMNANFNKLIEKHVRNAEQELTGVLTADQLKKWSEYRKEHSGISMTQTQTFEGAQEVTAPKNNTDF